MQARVLLSFEPGFSADNDYGESLLRGLSPMPQGVEYLSYTIGTPHIMLFNDAMCLANQSASLQNLNRPDAAGAKNCYELFGVMHLKTSSLRGTLT